MTEVVPPYTDEQLLAESVSKKDIITFLQANSSEQFQVDRKLKGSAKNVIKIKNKEQLIEDYKLLFSTKAFRGAGETAGEGGASKDVKGKSDSAEPAAQKAKKPDAKVQEVKYTKKIIKTGDKTRFPGKGDEVECYYTGKLDNGKVFDSNMEADKKGVKKPLKFKVGIGKVIRGWDEALLTMSVGEVAEVIIQPEWAYGKKGVEGKVPPGATLTFQVELVSLC
jgi:FK506-binding protein 3